MNKYIPIITIRILYSCIIRRAKPVFSGYVDMKRHCTDIVTQRRDFTRVKDWFFFVVNPFCENDKYRGWVIHDGRWRASTTPDQHASRNRHDADNFFRFFPFIFCCPFFFAPFHSLVTRTENVWWHYNAGWADGRKVALKGWNHPGDKNTLRWPDKKMDGKKKERCDKTAWCFSTVSANFSNHRDNRVNDPSSLHRISSRFFSYRIYIL